MRRNELIFCRQNNLVRGTFLHTKVDNIKIKQHMSKKLLTIKKDEVSAALYTRLRSKGAQPARPYGLAKVRKQGHQFVLSSLHW